MSKFNAKTLKNNVKTYEGGAAYTKDSLSNFFEFAFGNLLGNDFYESGNTQLVRLNDLANDIILQYGPEFAAKVSIFGRNEIGIRSVSSYIAAILNDYTFARKRSYYATMFRRIDDASETFAAVGSLGSKPSHGLVRGTKDFLQKQNEYSLMKYQLKGHEYNLHDLINITHAYSHAIDGYQNNRLAPAETWEVRVSGAKSLEERDAEWLHLLSEHKLGYMALLKNVRNIVAAIERTTFTTESGFLGAVHELCYQLTNEQAIRRSLVFPYRIYQCYRSCGTTNIDIVKALNDAFRISVKNMPHLKNSLYILDCSGSMDDRIFPNSSISIKEAAACYCCAAYLAGEGDFVKFGNECKQVKLSRLDNPFETINKMTSNDGVGFGTQMDSVFEWLENTEKSYDRYFVFSDMQCFSTDGYWWTRPKYETKDFINKRIASENSQWYSFDIAAYNTTPFNPWSKNVHGITGLSDKIFQMVPLIESGEDSIKDYIDRNVTF